MTLGKTTQDWDIDTLPNRLTIFRIILVPFIIIPLFLLSLDLGVLRPWKTLLSHSAAWIFVVAALTDFFDGHIARKRKVVTIFGHFLDPIADKFLVVSSLILLGGLGRVPQLIVVVLVLRELFITSLRLLAQERGLSVPVQLSGKLKSLTQMVALPLLMVGEVSLGSPTYLIGTILIYGASLLSLYSAVFYCLDILKKMRIKKRGDSP